MCLMMDDCYKVSICVPVYGVETKIERCVVSLFEQSYNNIEFIFVNDCTKDRSIEILNEIIERYPLRKKSVRIVNHAKNRGLAAARNTAISHCTGKFVLHVDSDDYIENNTVELLVKKQQENDADIVIYGYRLYNKHYVIENRRDELQNDTDVLYSFLSQNTVAFVCGIFIRLSLYVDNHIFVKEGCNMLEDWQTTPRLIYYANHVTVLREVLYNYDATNENSYTYSFSEEKCEQIWHTVDILKTFFADKGTACMEALECGISRVLMMQLIGCVRNGKSKEYYKILRKRFYELNPKNIRLSLKWQYRIVLKIKQYDVLRFYVLIATSLKHLLKTNAIIPFAFFVINA